ncbi:MAG: class I SAM-dependent methyltransferase [Niastella sp.]|nr:class I SAM-dependent methyltransferase [Niastella sp.]
MLTANYQLSQPITFLQRIIRQGGPEISEYDQLAQIADELHAAHKAGRFSDIDLQILQESFGAEELNHTLHGHSISRPYGYAGDFMIIDKIYREYVTPDKRFAKWDLLWHSQAACKAVRNRKSYFKQVMFDRLAGKPKFSLLNVASGPARDLAELYALIEPGILETTCIEADERAIAYAKELNKANLDSIRFIQQNIFRHEDDAQYEMVWSAGLFDYFTDRVFVKILRRFISWTQPGGEIIIGNFNTENPSRSFMELFGDWYLHHRSANRLTELALEAGISKRNIRVEQESAGVNLFLHVRV